MTLCRAVLCAITLTPTGLAAAETAYMVKPPEVTLAVGDHPGDLRRTIQPFTNWTMICDENLKKRRRVCNISQSITDGAGTAVFSWSLAATANGSPVMILRAPTASGEQRSARLDFGLDAKPVDMPLPTCSEELCLGLLPIDTTFKRLIAKGTPAQVSTLSRGGEPISFVAPLQGLATAVAALK